MYYSGLRNPLGSNTAIVKLLESYRNGIFGHFGRDELPTDFISHELGYPIKNYLDGLEESGIIRMFYKDKQLMVSLREA